MNFNLKKSAFTLAETLIVIGIIGVIASLTIPSLSNETNSKEAVTKLKKTQAILEDAYGRAEAQYGPLSDWTTVDTKTFTQRMTGSMKLSKVCSTTAADTGCFGNLATANFLKPSDGTTAAALSAVTTGKVILSDESAIAFYIEDANCSKDVTGGNASLPDLQKVCGSVTVDINGPSKGKSLWGKDLFAFYITKHGLYPVGMDGDTKAKFIDNCTKKVPDNGVGTGCTAWVVTNGNMDYADVNKDTAKCLKGNTSAVLGWTSQTSCR